MANRNSLLLSAKWKQHECSRLMNEYRSYWKMSHYSIIWTANKNYLDLTYAPAKKVAHLSVSHKWPKILLSDTSSSRVHWVLKTFNILEEEFYLMHLLRFWFYLNKIISSPYCTPSNTIKKLYLQSLRKKKSQPLLTYFTDMPKTPILYLIAFLSILYYCFPICTFITLQTFIHALLLSESRLWT